MPSSAAFQINELILPKVAAVLSMVGSAVIIGEVSKEWKIHRRDLGAVPRILLSMSIGDFLFSFAWFMAGWVISGEEDPEDRHQTPTSGGCKFQAFLTQVGFSSSLCFSSSLAVMFLCLVRYNWSQQKVNRVLLPVSIVIWALCLCIGLVPLGLDLYHDAGPLCWIASTDQYDTSHLVFMLQILPIWLCIMLDSIVMFVVYRKIRDIGEVAQASSYFEQVKGKDSFVDGQGNNNFGHNGASNDEGLQGKQPCTQVSVECSLPVLVECSSFSPAEFADLENAKTGEVMCPAGEAATTHSHSRSKIAAVQGMWYIGGFVLTFGPTSLSVVVYLTTGEYVTWVYRMSYFFLALQGVWNFIIFSQGKREMKTWAGKRAKQLIWGCVCCKYRCQIVRREDTVSASIGAPCVAEEPQHRRSGDRSLDIKSAKGKATTLLSAVSTASTVMCSNRNSSTTSTTNNNLVYLNGTRTTIENGNRWNARGSDKATPPENTLICPDRSPSLTDMSCAGDDDPSVTDKNVNIAPVRPQRMPSSSDLSRDSTGESSTESDRQNGLLPSPQEGAPFLYDKLPSLVNGAPQCPERTISLGSAILLAPQCPEKTLSAGSALSSASQCPERTFSPGSAISSAPQCPERTLSAGSAISSMENSSCKNTLAQRSAGAPLRPTRMASDSDLSETSDTTSFMEDDSCIVIAL